MPAEHEYKYLLKRDGPTLMALSHIVLNLHPSSIINIQQGYLPSCTGLTVRIRHAITDNASKWFLTVKQDVFGRTIEIENEISEKDGEDLWSQTNYRLKKTRYRIKDGDLVWEVDKFLDGHRVYCVLAEIELPEKSPAPTDLPTFISDHLILAVPYGDKRFSSRKLSHISKTDLLYE